MSLAMAPAGLGDLEAAGAGKDLKSLRLDAIFNRDTGATDGDSDSGSSPSSSISSLPFADSDAESDCEPQARPAAGAAFAGEEGWRMGKRIEGCAGTTHWAMNEIAGSFLSVKVLEGRGRNGAPSRGRVLQEVARWKSVRHPNILAVMGFACVGDHLYVQMEVSTLGPLCNFLNEFGPLTGLPLRRATSDLVSAIHHLHNLAHPIAHGNVRAAALALDDERVLLCSDFGAAELDGEGMGAEGRVRSLRWAAPEAARRAAGGLEERDGDRRQGDIWSVGCTVLEMATADLPWGSDTPQQALIKILQGTSPASPQLPEDRLSSEGLDFCAACLTWGLELRPEASDLLSHPFIAELAA